MNSEIKKIETEILKHKNLYYQGKPEISDFEYDSLEEKLKSLSPNSDVLNFVGSDIFLGEKVEHDKKMLSLNKTYKPDELIKWKEANDIVSTFKIDGSSCSLVYEDGKLLVAKTRGDGRFGEKITNKTLFIENIPKKIFNPKRIEIRGEIYCSEKNFITLSEKMIEIGLEKPSSMRNIVAGLLGRKENIELCEHLSFQAFELISEDSLFDSESEKFELLKLLGFIIPEYNLNKSEEDILREVEAAKVFMSEGDYLIDGIVFTYNKISLHEELGETAHHPRYKMAFKFQGETKTTKINSISWQVSRNGYLTPVANIESVELSGAKVSRVTLHNFGMVEIHQLKEGDEIEIVRSGEVIPKFLSVVKSSQTPFDYPKNCPSCTQKVIKEDIRLICVNDLCPDKVKDNILNFIQKIGIDDLSSKRLEELIRAKLVKDIPSLYILKVDQLLTMDKVKEKLASKIIGNIESSKSVSLVTFLSALGISGGAYNKCEKIVMSGHSSIDDIFSLTEDKLQKIESFAEKSAKEFLTSFNSKREIVERLISYGFSFKQEAAVKSTAISGMKFCITGTLSMKRSDLQKIVKENGGIVQSGVSKETNFVITNDTESSSSKFKKAKSLDIAIINETKFLELIEG